MKYWIVGLLCALIALPALADAPEQGPKAPLRDVINDQAPIEGNIKVHQNRVFTVYFNEYDEMYKACGTSKCCRASVRRIRKAQVKPQYVSRDASLVCPEHFRKTSVRCPASLIWCESELRPKE